MPYYNPQYCPSTSEDSTFLTLLVKLPAAVQLAVRKRVRAQLCPSNVKTVFFFLRWPLSFTFLNPAVFHNARSLHRYSAFIAFLSLPSFKINIAVPYMKISSASSSSSPLKGFNGNFLEAALSKAKERINILRVTD